MLHWSVCWVYSNQVIGVPLRNPPTEESEAIPVRELVWATTPQNVEELSPPTGPRSSVAEAAGAWRGPIQFPPETVCHGAAAPPAIGSQSRAATRSRNEIWREWGTRPEILSVNAARFCLSALPPKSSIGTHALSSAAKIATYASRFSSVVLQAHRISGNPPGPRIVSRASRWTRRIRFPVVLGPSPTSVGPPRILPRAGPDWAGGPAARPTDGFSPEPAGSAAGAPPDPSDGPAPEPCERSTVRSSSDSVEGRPLRRPRSKPTTTPTTRRSTRSPNAGSSPAVELPVVRDGRTGANVAVSLVGPFTTTFSPLFGPVYGVAPPEPDPFQPTKANPSEEVARSASDVPGPTHLVRAPETFPPALP